MQISALAKDRLLYFTKNDPAAENQSIRLGIREEISGSFQYSIFFDTKKCTDIIVAISENECIIVDKNLHDDFLDNILIDWKIEGKYGNGFSIYQPMLDRCDCGREFFRS